MENTATNSRHHHRSNERSFPTSRSFEIFVQHGFSEFEVAAITHTLQVANRVVEKNIFKWSFVSNTPGFVNGAGGHILRAVPAVHDHGLSDHMIIVGGTGLKPKEWLPRIRAMRRRGCVVALLSSAATAYIQAANPDNAMVTTHWSDLVMLQETGCLSEVSTRLFERNGNIITAAGAGSTSEIVIGMLADMLSICEISEIGNHLVLPTIRNGHAEQKTSIADIYPGFGNSLGKAIKIMEQSVEEPMKISDLTQKIGVSIRQLERIFKAALGTTPSRFYKRLRLKRARSLVEGTHLSIIDIAMASGFSSTNTLASSFRLEYGVSPKQLRDRKSNSFL